MLAKIVKKVAIIFVPFAAEFKGFLKTKQQAGYLQFLKFKLGLWGSYWPQDGDCSVANVNNVYVGINSFIGRRGSYIQGAGGVYVGDYVRVAPNVGILSSNHDIYDHRKSIHEKIIICDYTWIGMNSVILPGVKLGTRTIVAAGSVVTKSFPDGYCVIGGVPAKIIKRLDKEKFHSWRDEHEYYGFYPKKTFEEKFPDVVKKIRREVDSLKSL